MARRRTASKRSRDRRLVTPTSPHHSKPDERLVRVAARIDRGTAEYCCVTRRVRTRSSFHSGRPRGRSGNQANPGAESWQYPCLGDPLGDHGPDHSTTRFRLLSQRLPRLALQHAQRASNATRHMLRNWSDGTGLCGRPRRRCLSSRERMVDCAAWIMLFTSKAAPKPRKTLAAHKALSCLLPRSDHGRTWRPWLESRRRAYSVRLRCDAHISNVSRKLFYSPCTCVLSFIVAHIFVLSLFFCMSFRFRSAAVPRSGQGLEQLLKTLAVKDARTMLCDVQDVPSAQAAVMAWSPKAVLHAAGVSTKEALLDVGREQLAVAFGPKAFGASNLHIATRSLPLEASLMISSISVFWCRVGQASYAAANAFLDTYACVCRAQGQNTFSFALPGVEGMGMGAALNDRSIQMALTEFDASFATLLMAQSISPP